MCCEVCNKTVAGDGVTLHRVNELGVKGIWRCKDCMTPEQVAAIDPVVADITKAIEEHNATT